MKPHQPAPELRCATVQFESRVDDRVFNLGRIEHFVREAEAEGVEILAFPEMCLFGPLWRTRHAPARLKELAETADGPSVRAVQRLAVRHGMAIGVGFLELGSRGELFEAYAVCLPEGTVHVHRKLHVEQEAITAGTNFTVFETPWGVRMAVLSGEDAEFVENVRIAALLGADMLLAPHQTAAHERGATVAGPGDPARPGTQVEAIEVALNGPSGRGRLMRWLPARAYDNGLFVLFANGVDREGSTGNAMILDPYGRVLAETWAAGDTLVLADLDFCVQPLAIGRRRLDRRRPELYGLLTEQQGKGEADEHGLYAGFCRPETSRSPGRRPSI